MKMRRVIRDITSQWRLVESSAALSHCMMGWDVMWLYSTLSPSLSLIWLCDDYRYLILSLAARTIVGPKNVDQAVLLLQQVWPTRTAQHSICPIDIPTLTPSLSHHTSTSLSYLPSPITLALLYLTFPLPSPPHTSTSRKTCSTWWPPCCQAKQQRPRSATSSVRESTKSSTARWPPQMRFIGSSHTAHMHI